MACSRIFKSKTGQNCKVLSNHYNYLDFVKFPEYKNKVVMTIPLTEKMIEEYNYDLDSWKGEFMFIPSVIVHNFWEL